MEMKTFESGGRKAALYCGEKADAPLIVLNHYSEDDGDSVLRAMREIDTPDCSLLVVGNIRWNHDMAPWDCAPVIRNDAPYTGGADEHLNLLRTRMIPEALAMTGGRPSFLGIAGYSLAGLFTPARKAVFFPRRPGGQNKAPDSEDRTEQYRGDQGALRSAGHSRDLGAQSGQSFQRGCTQNREGNPGHSGIKKAKRSTKITEG